MRAATRAPAVAGRFYPARPGQMRAELASYLRGGPAEPAVAVVAPHAGWMYSGAVAGAAYAKVAVPQGAVVVCPNHTGLGVRRSIWCRGSWELPGGAVQVDAELAAKVRDHAELEEDELAHLREHAIEVQLPFLQARRPDVRVVPITLAGLSLPECRRVGEGLARALREVGSRALLVASTDMSHYVPAEQAQRLDALAIERMEALDPEGLYRVVSERGISMCGYVPTTVVLVAARALGAERAELVRYASSGDVSGDYAAVVGYASLVIR